jgi:hypothetical protein
MARQLLWIIALISTLQHSVKPRRTTRAVPARRWLRARGRSAFNLVSPCLDNPAFGRPAVRSASSCVELICHSMPPRTKSRSMDAEARFDRDQ